MYWSFNNMSYNSCPLFGSSWEAWKEHSDRLHEIFERDRQRQKEYEASQIRKDNQNINKSTQGK